MAHRIGFRGGSDVPSLHVADHHQALFLTVIHGLLIGDHAFHAKLFIHGDLRLHGRDQIRHRVHDPLIELPDGLRRPLQGLSAFRKSRFLNLLRDIL